MVDRSKLYGITLLTSSVIIIATYISWLLGYQGFLLIGTVTMAPGAILLIQAILFYTTFVMWTGVATNEYSHKLLKITIPYIGIYVLAEIFFSGTPITYGVLPLLYIMLLGLSRKDFKQTTIRALKYALIVFVYQSLASLVKVAALHFNQLDFSIYQVLAFSVDSIIFQGLLFLYGGEILRHVQLVNRFIQWSTNSTSNRNLECNISTRANDSNENGNEDNEVLQEFNSLSDWERKFTLLTYLGIQLVQCVIVLGIINLVNLLLPGGSFLIESIIILISFGLHGLVLRERWHSKSIITCSLVSSSLFFIAAKLTPSFSLFQLFPVIMGLLLVYSMYEIAQIKKRKTFQKWSNTITDLTVGKYSNVGNHLEVAIAKGLTDQDMELIGYKYSIADGASKLLGKLSPWNDGKYTKDDDSSD